MKGRWLKKCDRCLLCLEFADKILIFAVLERRLLQCRETEACFCFYNKQKWAHRVINGDGRTKLTIFATVDVLWRKKRKNQRIASICSVRRNVVSDANNTHLLIAFLRDLAHSFIVCWLSNHVPLMTTRLSDVVPPLSPSTSNYWVMLAKLLSRPIPIRYTASPGVGLHK